jgi:hypothetical protein
VEGISRSEKQRNDGTGGQKMELQKLIDGLKAHKNGAASYESVDEAIRVFETMRDVDGEKVVKGLETIAYNMPKIISWQYDDMLQNTVGTIECAIALIRQQQERIAELEAELGQRDYNAAVEMQQYCERYEPTYNPEDGSM